MGIPSGPGALFFKYFISVSTSSVVIVMSSPGEREARFLEVFWYVTCKLGGGGKWGENCFS